MKAEEEAWGVSQHGERNGNPNDDTVKIDMVSMNTASSPCPPEPAGIGGITPNTTTPKTLTYPGYLKPNPNQRMNSRGGLADIKLVYSDLAPHFTFPVFFETFLINLTFPLLFPYFWLKYGWGFIFTMGLSPFHARGYLNWLGQLVFYIMLITAFLAPENYYWRLPSSLFLVFIHRLMIGLKYASLSPDEYRLVLGIPEGADKDKYNYPTKAQQQQLDDYQLQMQLITGWVNVRFDRLRYELITAGDSSNIDVLSRYFKVPSESLGPLHKLQYQRWLHFLQVDTLGEVEPDGFHLVSLFSCCQNVIRVAEEKCLAPRKALYVIPLLAILNAGISVFFTDQDFLNISSIGIAFNVSSSLIALIYFGILETILFVAFLDYYRRYHYAMLLSRLARVLDAETKVHVSTSQKKMRASSVPSGSQRYVASEMNLNCGLEESDEENTNYTSKSCIFTLNTALTQQERNLKALEDTEHNYDVSITAIPKIDLLIPSNYIAWHHCKQVFLRFGKRTEFRLRIYLGMLLILGLLLLITVSFQMGVTNDAVGLIYSAYFLQSILYILVLGIQQSILIFVGGLANTKNLQHKGLMTAHGVHLHTKTENVSESCLQQLHDCMEKATAVKDACEAMSEAKPLKVLGVECTQERAVGLFSSVVLYIVAIVQYAVTKGGN